MLKTITIILLGMLLTACATTKPNPEAAGYNTQLALTYLQQGDVETAKSKMLLALQEAPNDPLVLDAMGYFLERIGEPQSAEPYYLKALKIAPESGAVQNNYGTYLCRQKHYRESIQYFLAAAKNINYLHVAEAYKNASLCALKIPDKKLAEKYLHKSLQM